MRNILNIKANGSLNIYSDDKCLKSLKKAHTWYTHKFVLLLLPFAFAIIDILGFIEIVEETIPSEYAYVATTALAAAFEVAPLYIGYAICLICYKRGNKIRNCVLVLSILAFIIGIASYVCLRILTYEYVFIDEQAYLGLPITIFMSSLPVITSLINIVIGCLSFDPLLIDMYRLAKQIKITQVRERQLKAYIEELNNDNELEQHLLIDELRCYNNTKLEILIMKNNLCNYIIAKVASLDVDK